MLTFLFPQLQTPTVLTLQRYHYYVSVEVLMLCLNKRGKQKEIIKGSRNGNENF